jgi:hypothetical protein
VRSTLAWLDHSEVQRRRMMEVVELFREKETVDDLGFGSIRDTFSELLFPGTSTLHTRAKYLLFLPWLGQVLENEGVASRHAWQRLKDLEVELIYALLSGGETEGVIGRNAKEKLRQFPSFMYWGALRRYGILAVPVTRGQLIESLDGLHAARRHAARTRDETDERSVPRNWHAGLPPAEPGFLERAMFELTPEQAGYLTDRIQASAPGSYLAHLVAAGVDAASDRPWADPTLPEADPEVQRQVAHARWFSQVTHGASLLYNLMLSEAIRELRSDGGRVHVGEDLVVDYRERLDTWVDEVGAVRSQLAAWDVTAFWKLILDANPRVPRGTRRFTHFWLEQVLHGDPRSLIDDSDVREVISAREFETKGGLARLTNPRQLDRFGGAVGAGALTYRWGSVRAVIGDIVSGREGVHA